MSYGNDFIILENLLDKLSHKTYDGGRHVHLVRHVVNVVGSCKRHGFFEEYVSYLLFVCMLRGHPMH